MEKKKITVFVAGQKLTLITEESEKYVNDIATKVDTAINSMFASTNMSKERCAVMVALDFCDDETKARAMMNDIKEQIKDYIEDSAKLREENEELKIKIEKLKAEKIELLTSKKTMIASSVEIKNDAEVEEETINADDDLSFEFEEKTAKVEEIVSQEAEKEEHAHLQPEKTVNSPAPKSEKKRHEHKHINPFKERFLKNADKGYTPVRQYSLFEEKDN